MPSNISMPIHVALPDYDLNGTYSQHAGVVMTSIFENTQSPVIIHVLHDETLTEDNRKKFIRTAEKYNQTVDLVDVKEYRTNLSEDILSVVYKTWSIGSVYRLFIPKVLNLDRVIYLDCDILVNLDIKELWETDMEGNCLGGVHVEILEKSKFSRNVICRKLNGCPAESYVNAGVLLMDLNRIRERGDLFERSISWLSRHKHSANYADQDAINSLFSGSVKLIDPKFNYLIYNAEAGRQPDKIASRIVHLVDHKPWHELKGLATEKLYWEMFRKSAWGEKMTIDDIIGKLCHVASLSQQLHRHTKQCYKQIGHRLLWDTVHPGFFGTIRILLTELYMRIRHKHAA